MNMIKSTLRAILYLVFFSALVVHASSDPYVGAYQPKDVDFLNLFIKKVDGIYYGQAITTMTPVEINTDHNLRSLDPLVDATGKFSAKSDGLFHNFELTLSGETISYERVDIDPALVSNFLFSGELNSIDIGQHSNNQCDNLFDVYGEPKISDAPQSITAIGKKANDDLYQYRLLNSILVLKDNELIYEQYFNGWESSDLHPVNSITKSIGSLMVGAALEQGVALNPEDSIAKLIPDYANKMSSQQQAISFLDVASFASGISWPEWDVDYMNSENISNQLSNSDDTIGFILNRELVHKPGEVFNYSAADMTLLGEALRVASAQETLSDVLKKGPLSSLCFENAYWAKNADGSTISDAGIQLTPRDMMKLGQVVLKEGKWQGKQLIDEGWLAMSITPNLETPFAATYGQLWWQIEYAFQGKLTDVIFAWGYGGQFIVIVPSLNTVVVMTANNPSVALELLHEIMRMHVIPAFQS